MRRLTLPILLLIVAFFTGAVLSANAAPTTPGFETTQSGDTWNSVANRRGVTADDLQAYNNVSRSTSNSSSPGVVGRVLFVPPLPPPTTTTTTLPPTTTTTLPPTTTTTIPATTTTAPVTTTTIAPTTTTTTPPACGGPITITTGGTYSGCYQSTSVSTPAVRISTSAPVTLDHAEVRHAGIGITHGVAGVQLTITNSKLSALDPGVTTSQRAVDFYQPGSLVVEHNDFTDGQGIYLQEATPAVVRVRFNDVLNIGRYPHPTGGNCCVQFVQLNDIVSPGVEIAWNKSTNIYGLSNVEDVVNMWLSSGTDAAHPIDIHHNLVDGAWPRTGNGASYTGGGLLLGDGGVGRWGRIHDNWIINTANYGVSIPGGQDNHLYNNRVVSDGKAGAVTVSATFSQGISMWDAYSTGTLARVDAYNNSVALLRPDGRADWWIPGCDPASACTGNVNLPTPTAATEQAERDNFAAAVAAAGHTIGADW